MPPKLQACTHCQRAKSACTDQRPCLRCTRLGIPCDDDPKPRKQACARCKHARVKCDLDAQQPCGRCCKFRLACVLHVPERRRRHAATSRATEEATTSLDCGPTALDPQAQDRGEGAAPATLQSAPTREEPPQPMPPLLLPATFVTAARPAAPVQFRSPPPARRPALPTGMRPGPPAPSMRLGPTSGGQVHPCSSPTCAQPGTPTAMWPSPSGVRQLMRPALPGGARAAAPSGMRPSTIAAPLPDSAQGVMWRGGCQPYAQPYAQPHAQPYAQPHVQPYAQLHGHHGQSAAPPPRANPTSAPVAWRTAASVEHASAGVGAGERLLLASTRPQAARPLERWRSPLSLPPPTLPLAVAVSDERLKEVARAGFCEATSRNAPVPEALQKRLRAPEPASGSSAVGGVPTASRCRSA